MKKTNTFFALFLLLSVLPLYAQNKINDEDLLKSELDRISEEKLPINSVAVNQKGDWIILYGDIGYSFVSMPEKLVKKLDTLNKKQTPLKDIDFPGKAGWLLLAANNAFYSDSVPEKLIISLKKINKQGKETVCFDNYKNKGIIIFDKNSYKQKEISEPLKKKLNNLKYRNQYIKNIALTENNGWVVLYAKRGFSYYNIPVALSEKLKELVKNGSHPDRVFFIADKWIIVYDGYKYASNL